jgi:hypothetical protein
MWASYSSNFGERFGAKRLELIPFFKTWAETPRAFTIADTKTSLRETLHLYWGSPDERFERSGVELGLWRCLFKPLEMMQLIDITYAPEDKHGYRRAQDFSVTQIGRTMMMEIVRTGATIQ